MFPVVPEISTKVSDNEKFNKYTITRQTDFTPTFFVYVFKAVVVI